MMRNEIGAFGSGATARGRHAVNTATHSASSGSTRAATTLEGFGLDCIIDSDDASVVRLHTIDIIDIIAHRRQVSCVASATVAAAQVAAAQVAAAQVAAAQVAAAC